MVGVILAGGRGRRYNKNLHKFLDVYRGKEIIKHIIESMNPFVNHMVLVVRPHNEQVKETLRGYPHIQYVVQEEALGTGHALLSTEKVLGDGEEDILVSYADKPLVTSDTFGRLVKKHQTSGADITFAVATLPDPMKKGRVIREKGRFVKIVEYKDASGEERKIKEIHAGFICAKSRYLFRELRKLNNNNAAGEYYLTDVYAIYLKDHLQVETVEINGIECYDINTALHLENIEHWKSLFAE